jgi:2-polyprenyl-3-methyl-5-hydroxy-6-metoxy-1,4-benzoquinol methylase
MSDVERVGLGRPDWSSTLFNLARHKFFRELMRSTDNVLVLGCGNWFTCDLLAEKVKSVTAVDIDDNIIMNNCKNSKSGRIHYATQDIRTIHIPKDLYDVILLADIIEHITTDDARILLKEISIKIKEDGVLMIATPRFKEERVKVKPYHLHEYTAEELNHMIAQFFKRTFFFAQTDETISTSFIDYAWNILTVSMYPYPER